MANTTVEIQVRYQDLERARQAAEQLDQTLRRIEDHRVNLQLQSQNALTRARGLEARATRDARDAINEQMRAQQAYNDMAEQHLRAQIDLINGIGSAIRGLGSASEWTASFAKDIGSAFSSMSNIFSTDIARYATASLTHRFVNDLIGNVSDVVSRYDILRTFVPYMSMMGVGGAQATSVQSRINESILGLPIGLDEATQRLRRYFMYTNDLDYAQNLVIGVQNAITAGGSGQTYQTQAYNMIERMLATGTLTNIRQWQSLLVGLGVSQQFIEEELGLPKGTLLENIREKTISVEEFLGALARIGEGTSSAAQKVNEALEIYRSTVESWIKNIEFAVTRGNERVLGAISDTLEAVSGKSIVDFMHEYRDFLNTVFYGTADFIRQNPGLVKQLLDDGKKLLNAMSRFSASRVVTNVASNITTLIDNFIRLLDKVPADRLEDFVSFAVTLAGPLGKLFAAVSSGAPAMIAIFDRFESFDWQLLIDAIANNVESYANFLESLLNFFTDEQLANIIAFGLVYGKPLGNLLRTIGQTFASLGIFFATGGAERLNSVFHLLVWFFEQIGAGVTGVGAAVVSAATAVAASPAAIPLGIAATVVGGGILLRNSVRNYEDERISTSNYIDSSITGARRYFLRRQQYEDSLAAYEAARLNARSSIQKNPNAEPYMLGETAEMQYRRREAEWLRRGMMLAAIEWRGDITNRLTARGLDPLNYFEEGEKTGDIKYGLGGIGRLTFEHFNPLTQEVLDYTQALYNAAVAYDDLYAAARESIAGQFSLWEDFELNDKITIGQTRTRMTADAGYAERYADAIEYLSNYLEENPNAAGYVSSFVNDLSIADLPTIEALVAQIESGAELPLDAWYALEAAINRCTEALIRFHSVADEKTYDKESAYGYFVQIFGDSEAVKQEFENLWGDTEEITETGLKTMRKVMGEGLKDVEEVTEHQVEQIDGAIQTLAYDPNWMYSNMKALMLALKAGLADWGDEAVREAWRVAYNVNHAFSSIQWNKYIASHLSGGESEGTWYDIEGGIRVYRENGGPVYAADGMFVPSGTDTVPAMLTPGEFVMRKRAVNTFGVNFMKYVNSLNIGAAFDSLVLSRERLFHGGGVTYNNSRDNHATVNQNIVTNSPGFTYKRAGRFVRGLA